MAFGILLILKYSTLAIQNTYYHMDLIKVTEANKDLTSTHTNKVQLQLPFCIGGYSTVHCSCP